MHYLDLTEVKAFLETCHTIYYVITGLESSGRLLDTRRWDFEHKVEARARGVLG